MDHTVPNNKPGILVELNWNMEIVEIGIPNDDIQKWLEKILEAL